MFRPRTPGSTKRSQGRNLRQELKQKPWGNAAYWLSLRGVCILLSYTPQDHQPRSGSPHSALGPPASIVHQEEPTYLPRGQSNGGSFSTVVLFSQTISPYVMLKQTNKQTRDTQDTLELPPSSAAPPALSSFAFQRCPASNHSLLELEGVPVII